MAGVAQAAVISYNNDFDATLTDGAGMNTTGTPVLIEATAVNYPGVYEAGKQVGIGMTDKQPGGAEGDGWMIFNTDNDAGVNSLAFFDLGSAFSAADGNSLQVDFVLGSRTDTNRSFDQGTVTVSFYSGLSNVTAAGGDQNLSTVNDTALATQVLTINSASYYDEDYTDNGLNIADIMHTESLTFSGLSDTAENLYLVFNFRTLNTNNSLDQGLLNNLSVTQIPELGTFALLAGLTGLTYVMLRRRRG